MSVAIPTRCARARAAKPTLDTLDTSPSQYILKLDRTTGVELDEPVHPDELLVRAHRDHHLVDIAVQYLASRAVEATGGEWMAKQGVRGWNSLGNGLAAAVRALTRSRGMERRARELLGVEKLDHLFRFRDPFPLTPKEVKARLAALGRGAREALAAQGRYSRLRIFLTGATGFLGKEVLVRAATDRRIAEVVCLLRPQRLRDPETNRPLEVVHAARRGAELLARLAINGDAARRIRFVEGDVERPGLGLRAAETDRLRRTLTHVVHCAASVSFDNRYDSLFRANVLGSRNVLAFSLRLQRSPGSPFVAHVAVETSYLHGRLLRGVAREGPVSFPPGFYNNFYELTKAMAAIETERAMMEQGLRVVQLLPSIVIGNARTGNNRGDTKVVNGPVNAFGRVKLALDAMLPSCWRDRARVWAIAALGTRFPADPSSELNLVPVDRVAAGVLSSLTSPQAVGAHIHLATDDRIRAADIIRTIREELEIDIRMADPTLTRTLTLPLVRRLLCVLGEKKLARALERLGAMFGGYSEWGQPVHGVGDDVAVLSLPARRPDTRHAFRMLCRHNRFVQEFGRVRDPVEIARRERLWEQLVDEIEFGTGRATASLSAREFRGMLEARIDLARFSERPTS